MGLFSFGKRETFVTAVTAEGQGRLRLNGVRSKDTQSKKAVQSHERTVCWVEFSLDGGMLDKGLGRAGVGRERLLRDLPANPTCRVVLDRLREGQDSVAKWLQLEPSEK